MAVSRLKDPNMIRHPNDWHLLKKEEVLHALDTDPYKGLSPRDVQRRRRTAGKNDIWRIHRVSEWEVARTAIFDLATLLLVISAAAAALFEKSTEAGALVVILLIGALLRTATYVRATRILEDRAKEKIPKASVIREGKLLLVEATELVPGDIVVLEPGDTVPCDGRVVMGEDSVVSERGVTENRSAVHKFDTVIETKSGGEEIPCEFRSNMLFAGSIVLSGSLRMVATACGEAALIGRKQGGVVIEGAEKLPYLDDLRIRSRNTSLVMLAFVMVLTALALLVKQNTSLADVFLGSMAMAVAAMSEFLAIIGTIMIAVALRDAAKLPSYKKAFLRQAGEKDSARGVIRQPEKMKDLLDVKRIVFCGTSFFKSGRSELHAYRAGGKYSLFNDGNTEDGESLRELLALALSASADSNLGMARGALADPNDTDMDALIRRGVDSYTKKTGLPLENSFVLYDHRDASSPDTMGMQISLLAKDNDVWAVSVGSVETVLSCCTHAQSEEGVVPLTEALRRQIGLECARLVYGGAAVLAVAMRKSPYMQLNRAAVLTQGMTFYGFFAVAEAPEEGASEHIREMKEAGIVPILFSEKPEADLYYCHRLGLFNKNTKRVSATELSRVRMDTLTEDGMIVSFENLDRLHMASARAKAMKYIMKGRLSEADKLLHKEDPVPLTAAFGRETWDSGVLAAADVGIAASRSDLRTVPETLSRYASVLVYTEHREPVEGGFGGLAGLLRAVGASAAAFDNMEKAKSYLTASQTARLVILFAAVLFDIPLLTAAFILVWGILFDFAAVLTMAFDTPVADEKLRLPKKTRYPKTLLSLTEGLLLGGLLVLYIPLIRLLAPALGFVLTGGEELALLSGSILLSAAAFAFHKMGLMQPGGKHRAHTAGMLLALSAVVTAVLLTCTAVSSIGGVFCGWKGLLALAPALLVTLIAVLAALVRKHKKAKKLQA